VVHATLVGKGLGRNLERLTDSWATSTSAPFPSPSFDDQKKTVSLKHRLDEGKPFYRLGASSFKGNRITRDKVIAAN